VASTVVNAMANTPMGCTTTSGAKLSALACSPAPAVMSTNPLIQRGARSTRAHCAHRRPPPPVAVRTAACCQHAATA
jgi:hypothetical protein